MPKTEKNKTQKTEWQIHFKTQIFTDLILKKFKRLSKNQEVTEISVVLKEFIFSILFLIKNRVGQRKI